MRSVYSVADVNKYLRNMFSQDFLLQNLTVKGELSNVKYHGSGHIYFTLKDASGQIACVMFRGSAVSLRFRLTDGQKVLVTGSIEVYEKGGSYQLYARSIQPDGEGDLYLRFEQLKKEMEDMGMFSPMYKKPIPKYIHTLGVVTAPSGAAVQDIINITTRRNPFVQIILYPALVQGAEAAPSIVRGIQALERYGVDLMIVGRGGGSIEDLWAFNEPQVAQAIFDCSVPIISAVGHETDTTIADFVSDLRAPTPSAAAELAVYEVEKLYEKLSKYHALLLSGQKNVLERKTLQLRRREEAVKRSAPLWKIREKRSLAVSIEERLKVAMDGRFIQARHKRDMYLQKLKGLSPLERIESGFAYVSTPDGKNLRSVNQIKEGERIKISLKDGDIEATAQRVISR